jgi:glycine cleavage system H protein
VPNTPQDLRYSKEHEWVLMRPDGTALVGITDFAQSELGDVVFFNLPEKGAKLTQFDRMGEIESVKSVSDLFSPVSGEVLSINTEATGKPELVNQSPYDKGWLITVRVANPRELGNLLTAAQYDAYVAAEAEKKEKKGH